MRIKEIRPLTISLPLESPVFVSNLSITHREYVLVEIEADNGLKGHGFGFTRDGLVSETIERNLSPLLVGQEAELTEKLWESMYYGTRYLGRKGLLMRAISAVDIALWDLKGKAAGMPLWKLLGGANRKVKAYAAGGYYRNGQTEAELQQEFRAYRDAGFHGAKMNLGGLSVEQDLRRVEAVRKAIGPDMALMADFNGSLRTAKEGIAFARKLEPFGLAFIEEPFLMDNKAAMKQLREGTTIPVAAGEDEAGRWAFADLIEGRTLDILRHDATLAGGISEWMKIAHLGAAFNIPVFPHWFPEVHIHLSAAFPCCTGVELIPPDSGIMNFYRLMDNPVAQQEGYALAPEEPGLGIQWKWDVIEQFAAATHKR